MNNEAAAGTYLRGIETLQLQIYQNYLVLGVFFIFRFLVHLAVFVNLVQNGARPWLGPSGTSRPL